MSDQAEITEDTPFVEEDDNYHRAVDDPFWVETTWWCFNIPERHLGMWLHAGYHTNRSPTVPRARRVCAYS